MNNLANFLVDNNACIGCGQCVRVCPGGILYLNEERKAEMEPITGFGWNGCWKCEHCLSVCPKGAISILGHQPEDSLPTVSAEKAAPVLDALISNRHTCRRFLDKNVDAAVIDAMLRRLGNAPNGGNKQQVEFTLLGDKAVTERFRKLVTEQMEQLAAQDVFPEGFDRLSYEDMQRWRDTVRPDMVFCGAPHLLIPHAPLGRGEPVPDVNIVCAYFELLCASRGLGCALLSFPLGVLNTMPEIKALLQIPENHYIGTIIGFGHPEIRYRRGSQRPIEEHRIHRLNMEDFQ